MKNSPRSDRRRRGGDRHPRMWVLLGALVVLALAAAPAHAGPPVELDEAFVRVEINATDGDAGFHAKFDGEPSKSMRIRDPRGRVIHEVKEKGALKRQGLTENFFESAEPTCVEQPLAEFLQRFPQGTYRFDGRTNEGQKLQGDAELSHALPAAPDISAVDGSTLPLPVVITWAGGSDLGNCHDPELVANNTIPDPAGVPVDSWEVTVEPDVEDDVLETLGLPRIVFTVQLLSNQLSVTVPSEYLQQYMDFGITTFKFEVGAKAGENQTFSEGSFEVAVP